MKQKIWWITCAVAVILLGVAAIMYRWPRVDRVTAERLALSELERYAMREQLSLLHFSEAEVTEEEGKWLYSYNYKGEPRQVVAIVVHKDGRTELSRMRDEAIQ